MNSEKDIVKTASEQYVKLTHIEHILKRPDTYIGSITNEMKDVFVVTDTTDFQKSKITYKNVNYNSGFVKIFDETITNASDYSIRTNQVTYIKVNIDENCISVENDGPGIPVVIHDTEKIYIPELIFGHLLTSNNYDDTEERFSAGRNGLGVKLVNIYSKKFILETSDGNKQYYQEFLDNLSTICKPKIKKSKKNYVKVTYYPDYEKFGLSGLTEDLKSVLYRRVFDISAYNPSVKVSLNGKIIPVRSFRDYMRLFTDSNIYYEKIDDYWEVGIAKSPCDTFTHVSMVNGIATIVGGTHVNFVSSNIVNSIKDILTKNNKGVNIKPIDIRNKMLLFINCKLINPVFDTQTKENLTSRLNGSTKNFKINDSLLKRLSKDEMFSEIVELSKMKEEIEASKELNKNVSKRIRIEKLVDANKAGTEESEKCHLFLSEGDSAKSLSIAGFSETGRDYYGVFPLRGKVLNVRDVSLGKMKENEEIIHLMQILGLEIGKKYKNLKSLRYGKIVIFSDADCDGYHIAGLLINLFDFYWPELLKLDFLYQFVTPIVRIKQGTKKKFFYKMNDYKKWLIENDNGKGWSTKYYKGLGTIEPVDGKQFFREIDKHLIKFHYDQPTETENIIDMAFRKKRSDDRKDWLLGYKPNNIIDKFVTPTTYHSFMNDEFIEFSMEDNLRSIPSLIDGFKPSQRKILFSLFKSNPKGELNVGELFGLVKANAEYNHGPASLEQAIVSMAQDYVGSNNISLLSPIGSFGTRLCGGKDAAAARYIYTELKSISKSFFMSIDNDILDYKIEDNKSVEPYYYVPIIPYILLNGSDGIGTGWSTLIPHYNINDLIDCIEKKLSGKKPKKLEPYYEGFKGTIVYDSETDNYITTGIINRVNTSTLNISELPIGVWNDDYYLKLDKLMDDKFIRNYTKNCTDTNVNIEVRIPRETLSEMTDEDLINKFELTSKINMSNMNLFDRNGKIKKYNTSNEILDDYYDVRLEYYDKRKEYLLSKYSEKKYWFENVIKFIKMVISGKLIINKVPIETIKENLEKNKFIKIDNSYQYLLGIPIYKFSKEELDKLNNDYKELIDIIDDLKSKDNKKLWHEDLVELKKEVKKLKK